MIGKLGTCLAIKVKYRYIGKLFSYFAFAAFPLLVALSITTVLADGTNYCDKTLCEHVPGYGTHVACSSNSVCCRACELGKSTLANRTILGFLR